MRVYSATQTLFNGTDPVPYNAIPSGRYFRSHADARKWGNSLIRSFLEMQRQWDKGFRLEKWTPQTKWTKVEVGDGDTLRS